MVSSLVLLRRGADSEFARGCPGTGLDFTRGRRGIAGAKIAKDGVAIACRPPSLLCPPRNVLYSTGALHLPIEHAACGTSSPTNRGRCHPEARTPGCGVRLYRGGAIHGAEFWLRGDGTQSKGQQCDCLQRHRCPRRPPRVEVSARDRARLQPAATTGSIRLLFPCTRKRERFSTQRWALAPSTSAAQGIGATARALTQASGLYSTGELPHSL